MNEKSPNVLVNVKRSPIKKKSPDVKKSPNQASNKKKKSPTLKTKRKGRLAARFSTVPRGQPLISGMLRKKKEASDIGTLEEDQTEIETLINPTPAPENRGGHLYADNKEGMDLLNNPIGERKKPKRRYTVVERLEYQTKIRDGETMRRCSEGDVLEYDVRGGDASTDGTRC